MKYAINRGQKIAYDVFGQGSAVVLQHGFLSNRRHWEEFGYLNKLSEKFMVITIDSLGHGDSDKPANAEYYNRKSRVNDIVAVLDTEKINKAHYVGYSMGGWLGIGLLKYNADRLLSITIGGWDPAPNETQSMLAQMNIDQFLDLVREQAPLIVNWVTSEVKPALDVCKKAVGITEIPADVLINCKLPVHLWIGLKDFFYSGVKAIHNKMPDSKLSEIKGDHIRAFMKTHSVEAVYNFLNECESKS